MRTTTKLGAALAVIGALALSACGGSSPLIDSSASGTRTKNAALGSDSGLNVKVFKMNLKSVDSSKGNEWGQGIEGQISREESKHDKCDNAVSTISNFDAEALEKIQSTCQREYVMAHMTGFITAPGNAGDKVTVKFTAVKDDTFAMKIGGKEVIDAWNNTGCEAVEGTIEMVAGKKYPIDAWYSNFRGNGGCMQLQWTVGAEPNVVVPASAFSTRGNRGGATEDGAEGLVGYWSFDDEANFTKSDQGAVLTAVGGAAYTATGKLGGGLALNGNKQYLDGPTGTVKGLPEGKSNYTISTWFNASALGVRGMVGWGRWGTTNATNALRIFGNGGGFRHYWWSNDLDSNVSLSTNTWYHVAATFDGTTRMLYLNGKELVKNTPNGNAHTVQDINFSIGRTNNSEYFSGILDEVGIWNRALTAAEIAELAGAEGSEGSAGAAAVTTTVPVATTAVPVTSVPQSSMPPASSTPASSVPVPTTAAPTTSTTEAVAAKNAVLTDQPDTMLVESDETYDVRNNKTFKAPAGKKFGKVLWASYGTPTVNNKELTLSKCHSTKSIEVVQAAAGDKTSFVLPAGNGNYGDPCYGTYKRVKALITLVDDPNYVPAEDPNPGVRTDAPDTMFIETAEHYPKTVTAPEGKKFGKVLFASYGIQKLEGNKVFYGWCNSTTSMKVVTTSLFDKTTGTVLAGNGNYGDPCYGTYKYVKVVVSLVDDPNYKKPETPTTTTEPKQIAAPKNVAATPGNGSADITWDASAKGNTEVVSYMVQISADKFETSTTMNVTTLEAIALGLANGQEYQVRVAGVNKPAGVISEWSSVVTVTPVAPAVTTTTTVEPEATAKVQTVTPVITPTEKVVEVAADTTTVDCNKACFDAVVASLGATEGPVFVSVDGGERIQLDGSEFTKIPVGKAGQKLTFMAVVDDVVQQVSVPVKRAGEAAPAANTASGNSGGGSSSNNTVWLMLLLIAIVLGGGGYAVSKKRGNGNS